MWRCQYSNEDVNIAITKAKTIFQVYLSMLHMTWSSSSDSSNNSSSPNSVYLSVYIGHLCFVADLHVGKSYIVYKDTINIAGWMDGEEEGGGGGREGGHGPFYGRALTYIEVSI